MSLMGSSSAMGFAANCVWKWEVEMVVLVFA